LIEKLRTCEPLFGRQPSKPIPLTASHPNRDALGEIPALTRRSPPPFVSVAPRATHRLTAVVADSELAGALGQVGGRGLVAQLTAYRALLTEPLPN
jgi:hypothetical protein